MTNESRDEYAARLVADWRVDEAQMGRIAALLRVDTPVAPRPEQAPSTPLEEAS